MRSPSFIRSVLVILITVFCSVAMAGDLTSVRYSTIPSGAYAVVAEIRAKVGKERELRDITIQLVEKVRAEPQNIVYFLHEDPNTPGRFVFYEIFSTKEGFDAHVDTPHVQAWFARLPELADGNVQVTHLQLLGNVP